MLFNLTAGVTTLKDSRIGTHIGIRVKGAQVSALMFLINSSTFLIDSGENAGLNERQELMAHYAFCPLYIF
jgi:hypothetical protein